MAHVSLAAVQGWLERTKLTIPQYDPQLESTAANIAIGTLADVYDVTLWIDEASTPALVRDVIAMLVAAWTYNRAYSEEDPDGSGYAMWLEAKAMALLAGIKDGTIDLAEIPGVAASSGSISFLPNDLTGSSEVYDGTGVLIGLAGSQDRKFNMGQTW